jgi:hypothetical protein
MKFLYAPPPPQPQQQEQCPPPTTTTTNQVLLCTTTTTKLNEVLVYFFKTSAFTLRQGLKTCYHLMLNLVFGPSPMTQQQQKIEKNIIGGKLQLSFYWQILLESEI